MYFLNTFLGVAFPSSVSSSFGTESKTARPTVVYRRVNCSDETLAKVKSSFWFYSFVSTTWNPSVAEEWPGNLLMIIDVSNVLCGAPIAHLSQFVGECEFLIGPNHQYEIVKFVKANDERKYNEVYLRCQYVIEND